MNFQEENEKLIKANATLVESINVSKLALEQSKKQESEGLAVLLKLADDIVEANSSTEVVKKELYKLQQELERSLAEKSKVELAIETAQKDAVEAALEEKTKHEAKLQALRSDIQIKQDELSECVSKTRAEILALNTVKGEISLLNVELLKAGSRLDDITSVSLAKESELAGVNISIDAAETKLANVLRTIKDTEISTEAYEDRKAVLIAEITVLEEDMDSKRLISNEIKSNIAKLEAERATKEAEYKTSEAKVFELIEREEALNEREAYARERFKVANLEY